MGVWLWVQAYICHAMRVLGQLKGHLSRSQSFPSTLWRGLSYCFYRWAAYSRLAAPQISGRGSSLCLPSWLQIHSTASGLLCGFWGLNSGWLPSLHGQQFCFLRNLPSQKPSSFVYSPGSSFVLDRLDNYSFLICVYARVYNVWVYMCVQCVCMHSHPGTCDCVHAMARGHLGCQPLPFTSFETGFPSCFSIANAGLAGLQASRILLPLFHISPAPRSVRITGVHIYTASFSLTIRLGFHSKHFIHWVISPAPVSTVLFHS